MAKDGVTHAIGSCARRTGPTQVVRSTARTRDTVNDDPMFLEMMADEVLKTWERYRSGRPLCLSPPIRTIQV